MSVISVEDAQRDMRRAYAGGGPGAIVSAIVWFAAWIARDVAGVSTAFAVLFFGGMAIFPLATLVCRQGFGRAKEDAANPLGRVALESTIAMIGALLAAWLFLDLAPARVFPLAAIAVGTHYFAFRTVYGDISFWALGAAITTVGLLDLFGVVPLPPGSAILAVALVEALFGLWLIRNS